jgi:glucose-1-phosphate thymidylyltransferase
MKGIVLAGGSGTRLHPVTQVISKQLLPVYDKPMVFYPLSLLLRAGIRQILIISTPRDLQAFHDLLGDGSRFGVEFTYREQARPEGLAQAFLIGREFLAGSPACLVLGDNILHGPGLTETLTECATLQDGAHIFGYRVRDAQRYGVVEINADGHAVSIEEKPTRPRSRLAVPGLYFYGPDVCDLAAELEPSARGELEITDLNQRYLEQHRLTVTVLDRGYAWLDAGTHRSLIEASNYIEAIEERQGLKIGCLQEIAWSKGWISRDDFRREVEAAVGSSYGAYLAEVLESAESERAGD